MEWQWIIGGLNIPPNLYITVPNAAVPHVTAHPSTNSNELHEYTQYATALERVKETKSAPIAGFCLAANTLHQQRRTA